MAPDYNDGSWHGWNGGECPVHGLSMVEAFYPDVSPRTMAQLVDACTARQRDWKALRAFRVVEEYREPHEIWHLLDGKGEVCDTFTDPKRAHEALTINRASGRSAYHLRHYREVMDGEAQ